LTGVAILLAFSFLENRTLGFGVAVKKVRKCLGSIVLFAILNTTLVGLLHRGEGFLFRIGFDFAGRGLLYRALEVLQIIAPYINFFLVIVLQTFLIFIIPLVVLENKKFLQAIGNSLAIGWKNFFRVYALLLLPMLCYSPIWLFKGNTAFFVKKTLTPEVIIWIYSIGIPATLLVDTFVAVCAMLFLVRLKK